VSDGKIVLDDDTYQHNILRTMSYVEQLHSEAGEQHLAYLIEERGLTLETIKRFYLGAVLEPDPVDEFAAGRICIPHINLRGPSVLRFRALPGHGEPKYWQPAGSNVSVYNVTELNHPHEYMVIAEGEIDTITLAQCGLPAVGFPGANTWKDHHRYLFDGLLRTFIAGDGDEAGEGFMAKVAGKVPGPRAVSMPPGMDVNDVYRQGGREAVLERLGINQEEA
jgi:DNA primase